MTMTMDPTSTWTAWPEADELHLQATQVALVHAVAPQADIVRRDADGKHERTAGSRVAGSEASDHVAARLVPAVLVPEVFVPAVLEPRTRTTKHNLDFLGLKRLMVEEEKLAFESVTDGLSPAGQARLSAIETELDRRWALFG